MLGSPLSAQAWPCPQNISPADLGYNAQISFKSKDFLVWSLKLLITAPDPSMVWHYSGIYRTFPTTPIDVSGQYIWVDATVYTKCQRVPWVNPATGAQTGLIIVQEDTKSGIVVDRHIACGPGGSTGGGGTGVTEPVAEASYDPYSSEESNPYSNACGESGEGGGLGGGSGGSGSSLCGGSSTLVWEAVCIDIWVEEVGWVEWWCGVVAVCG